MVVDEAQPIEAAVYRDREYFFCSHECRAAFVRNPEGYLKDRPQLQEATTEPPTSSF